MDSRALGYARAMAEDGVAQIPVTGSHDPKLLRNLVRFSRMARRLGIPSSSEEVNLLLEACTHIDVEDRQRFRHAARAIFVGRREEIELFDRLFDLVFRRDAARPPNEIDLGSIRRRLAEQHRRPAARVSPEPPSDKGDELQVEADLVETVQDYSAAETLRRKDFAHLSDAERATLKRLLAERPLVLPPRRTRRYCPAPHGHRLDLRRTLRSAAHHLGEPVHLYKRKRRQRHRPLLVLCDISGSMETYSRIFLQFAYGLRTSTERLEVFVFGTRLTRITRQLDHTDIDLALGSAVARIVDWGGGTRIGESFRLFNQQWSRRVLGGGAVAMVLSDAWDRGDPELLAAETARLSRCCHRLIWLNPLIGSEGYEPLSSGVRAILPHVDDFRPVHNLQSLEQLASALAEIGPRGGTRSRARPPRSARIPTSQA